MAATTGDIIRITDRQTFVGQTVLNVYFYQVNLTTALIGDYLAVLGDWFHDNIVVPVAAIQNEGVTHTELFLENLTNGVDIETYVTDFPVVGAVSGTDPLPPFVSFGFQLIREERTTRNGYKRFAGVSEDVNDGGTYVGSMTPINTIEDKLASDIVIGLVNTANPVIVHHPISIPLVSPTLAHIGSALFRGLGSQNTRKLGRGI